MEINPLAAQYLNQAYVFFSNSADSPAPSPANLTGPANRTDFMRLLEAAGENQSKADTDENSVSVFAKGKAVIDKSSELYEACLELETFMLKTLITSMRNTIQKTELVETGFAGKIYEDMLYDEYAKEFAKNANLGFAEMAYIELTGQKGKYINQRVV
jgi:flagellar protein FlgJ